MFIATGTDELFVFAHGKEKKLLAKVESDAAVFAGPVFANGALHVASDTTLSVVRGRR